MPIKLQILHASDFEAGIPALDDAVRFSAIVNYFKTATTGQFAAPADALANTLTLSSGDNLIPGPFLYGSSDPGLNGVGGLGTSSSPLIGRGDIAILNALGIQASTVGNHDLDLGVRQFGDALRSGSGSPGSHFPYLSSNLDFTPEVTAGNLRSTDLATDPSTAEASTIKGKLAKSTVITVPGNDGIAGTADDQKIGIVGATTPLLPQITSSGQIKVLPASATDYAALAGEIQKSVDALTNAGINKVILLSHMQELNIERDELAPRLRNVDVIIAGGSHTPLLDGNDPARADGNTPQSGYPIVKTAANGQPILVLNTDSNYRYVGRLVVEFDDNGVLNLNSLNPALNGAFATDEAGVDRVYGSDINPKQVANPNIVAITDALRTVISTKDNVITGKTNFFLNGTRSDVRTQETNLGNVTADANLNYAKQLDATTVISLKNGGGIRDNIGTVLSASGNQAVQKLPPQPNPLAPNKTAGAVSQLDIENSLRFNNGLSLVTITARQLLEILEHGVAETAPGNTPGRFPQVGGLIFSYDPDRAAAEDANGNGVLDAGEDKNGNGLLDAGQRIRSIALTNDQGKVTELVVQDGAITGNADRTFRLVTLNFLADGGDAYPLKRFTDANPTLANRVDLTKKGVRDGAFTFADTGSEQDALAEYLLKIGSFNQQDTDKAQDTRIQDLSTRNDGVLDSDRQFTGNNQKNRLVGAAGDDTLLGQSGADVLRGLGGDDLLNGGKGNDRLDGGINNDVLIAGAGNDIVTCGKGRDVVVLDKGRGSVLVRDFTAADKLGLEKGFKFGSLEFTQSGRNTMIKQGNDLLAILRNVEAGSLNRRDFTTNFSG